MFSLEGNAKQTIHQNFLRRKLVNRKFSYLAKRLVLNRKCDDKTDNRYYFFIMINDRYKYIYH